MKQEVMDKYKLTQEELEAEIKFCWFAGCSPDHDDLWSVMCAEVKTNPKLEMFRTGSFA